MHRVCNNCGATQGPFFSIRLFFETKWACKNTKKQQDRVKECVERREKKDAARYKESLHPYDVA